MAKKPLNLSVSPALVPTAQEPVKKPLSPTLSQGKSFPKAKQEEDLDEEEREISGVVGTEYGSSDVPIRLAHPPEILPHSPTHPTLATALPLSPVPESKSAHGQSWSIFTSYRARSTGRLHPGDATIRPVPNTTVERRPMGQERAIYSHREGMESSPDLTSMTYPQAEELVLAPDQLPAEAYYPSEGSNIVINSSHATGRRDAGPKKPRLRPRPFAHLLNRTRSVRTDGVELTPRHTPKSSAQHRFAEVEHAPHKIDEPGLKTAPLHEGDRSFRDMMSSTIRNRSADRQPSAGSESGSAVSSKENGKHHAPFSSSYKEGSGSAFLSNLKSSSTRAADGIGKAGKGIFGKLGRSGSNSDRDVINDESYVCTVINLPLVEQTRRTRISKRLEDSRDKTEFWMPALPWRCIDYLNYKGCEEEGLYRIPGSGFKVKQWQRRFDTELDINLFDEPDLYDINIIGSMFKAWLRELPDELLPKETQGRIAEQCMGATEVPQMLKDELSKLPPYNYYLLFAITCHLSLLHSYVEQNKMDYRNLCICFQPCLKMDGFCFHFLVCEWKHCWQGCWTEKEALAAEYRVLEGGEPPSSAGDSTVESRELIDERAVSSSESSKPPSFTPEPDPADKKMHVPLTAAATATTTVTVEDELMVPFANVTVEEDDVASLSADDDVDEEEHERQQHPSPEPAEPPPPPPPPELSPLMPLSPLQI